MHCKRNINKFIAVLLVLSLLIGITGTAFAEQTGIDEKKEESGNIIETSPGPAISDTPEPTATPWQSLGSEPTPEPTATPWQSLGSEPTTEPTATPWQSLGSEPTPEPTATPEAEVPLEASLNSQPDSSGMAPAIVAFLEQNTAESQAGTSQDSVSANSEKTVLFSGTAEALQNYQAGVDFRSGELIFTAENRQEAQTVAQAYGADLKSYSYGVGILTFDWIDINQMLLMCEKIRGTGARIYSADGEEMPTLLPNYLVHTCEDSLMETAVKELRSAAADTVTIASVSVNDPMYSSQWFHSNSRTLGAWNAGALGLNVKIAILDTGICQHHPDLEDNIIGAYDVCYDTEDQLEDGNGHGSHVAGIAAAVLNNNTGGVGVAPSAGILSIRVLDDSGSGDYAGAMRGINLAVSLGADVVNMSFGGYINDSSGTFQSVVNSAANSGVILVAAAGNGKPDAFGTYYGVSDEMYPAALNNVIAVGNITSSNTREASSNYGSWVDIAAPGTSIYSTYYDNYYCTMTGTSMASPVIAGVAALILSQSSTLRADKSISRVNTVRQIMCNTATALPSSYQLGAGRVNAEYAVQQNGKLTVYNGVDYSAVYDPDYYADNARQPGLFAALGNNYYTLLQHFIYNGMAEGRQASEEFNVYAYDENYPGLRAILGGSNKAMYMHYVNYGQSEGRNAATTTRYQGVDYSAVFDPDYYADNAHQPGLYAALYYNSYALIQHFVYSGMAEGRQASAEFNVHFYDANYPLLRPILGGSNKALYMHYVKFGKAEHRVADHLL